MVLEELELSSLHWLEELLGRSLQAAAAAAVACCAGEPHGDLCRLADQWASNSEACDYSDGEHGGSPSGHSQAWRVACQMQPTDGPAMEHDSWCRVQEAMFVYDQLDTTNLASAELV